MCKTSDLHPGPPIGAHRRDTGVLRAAGGLIGGAGHAAGPNGVGCDPASTAVDPNKSTLGRERCVFTLDAGEALYLPATWAHQVESTPASSDAPDPSEHIFSVNRFYPTPLSQNCGRWQVGWWLDWWLVARLRLFHWLADTVADGGAQKVWAMLGLLLCGMMTAMVWIGLKYGNVGLETV